MISDHLVRDHPTPFDRLAKEGLGTRRVAVLTLELFSFITLRSCGIFRRASRDRQLRRYTLLHVSFESPVPMLSQFASRVPTGGQWLYEPKFDGFRGLLCQARNGLLRLTSRQGKDLTGWFPDLYGISIGSVTLLDDSCPWWVGVGGITERFGVELDSRAIAAVPVLLVVGELDAEPADVPIDRDESVWTEGINDSGRTRLERITSLQRNLEAIGASTRLVAVPNVAHAGLKVFAPVIEFFSRQIRG